MMYLLLLLLLFFLPFLLLVCLFDYFVTFGHLDKLGMTFGIHVRYLYEENVSFCLFCG